MKEYAEHVFYEAYVKLDGETFKKTCMPPEVGGPLEATSLEKLKKIVKKHNGYLLRITKTIEKE